MSFLYRCTRPFVVWSVMLCTIVSVAKGQGRVRPYAGGGTNPPPIVTFTPSVVSDTLFAHAQTITICPNASVPISGDTAWFNGTLITNFAAGGGTGCVQSSGTYTLVAGQNTFTVDACSKFFNGNSGSCGSFGMNISHPALAVTPKGQTLILSPATNGSQTFHVSNYTPTQTTYSFAVSCTGGGVSSCSTPSPLTVNPQSVGTVTVTYTVTPTLTPSDSAGVIQLTATAGSFHDVGSYNYLVNGAMSVSTKYTNEEDQDLSRCAATCFSARTMMSTVPYITKDKGRSIGLVYVGDRVAARSIVSADITMAPGAPTLTKLTFQAQVHGVWATFTNGETILNFSVTPLNGSTKPFRLAGAINVDQTLGAGYASGAYQMQLVVSAQYADGHTEQFVDTSHALAVLDQRPSRVARGWAILGVPRLYSYYHTNGAIDQLRYMATTGDGSLVTYNATNGCVDVCDWNIPAGVFSTIANHDSLGVPRSPERDFPDSSKEVYSNNGPQIAYTVSRTLTDTVRYTFDSAGVDARLLTLSDPFRLFSGAHTYTTLHYDTHGHLSQIIEPRGSDNSPGNGRVTSVTVDANGYLRTWKDPDGDTTHFGYDSLGRLDSLVDRNGNVTTYSYEPIASKLAAISSPLVQLDFNSTGTLNTIHLVTTYQPWQLVGVPTSATSSTPWTPVEADTIEAMVTTTAGDTSHFTVDQWGQPLFVTGNDTIHTTYVRNANGFATTVTRPLGPSDTYQYTGPYLTAVQLAGQDATGYQYGPFGQISQIAGRNQATQTFYLGNRGHVDSLTVAGGTTHFYPDAHGRDTSVVNGLGNITRYAYDAWTGNVDTIMSWPSKRYRAKTFDRYGRDSVVRVSGQGSPTTATTTTYDLLNRQDSVFDGVHPAPTVFKRDGINVTSVTDPSGQVFTMTYNALGKEVTQTDPTNRTTTITYASHLQVATVTNRRGQMTKYLYDPLVRLTHVHRPPSMTGELDTLEIVTSSRLGDTINVWNPVTREISYLSRTTGYLDSSVTIFLLSGNRSFKRTYFHDSRGRVDSVAVTTSSNVTGIDPYPQAFHYDATTSLLDNVVMGPDTIAFRYNGIFKPDTVTYSGSPGMRNDTYTSNNLVSTTTWTGLNLYRGYGYDSTGRIIEVDHGIPAPDTVEFFTYDPLGQLAQRQVSKWTDNVTSCPGTQLYGNGCSAAGNRTFQTLVQDNYSFDAAGNLDTVKVGSADTVGTFLSGNRLASWGGASFRGDSEGNRDTTTVGSTKTAYTWSSDGRLLSVVSGSTTRVYDYDNYGLLARRTTNGTVDRYYLWDGGQLMAILDGSANTRVAEFVYNPGSIDIPLARITGAKGSSHVHYYARDAMGNVIAQFSGSTVEQGLTYDPWGAAQVMSTTGDTTQLRWKGLLYEDGVTSLYYARGRWIDPVTRRFVSPDPIGLLGGLNKFAFGGGDPINHSDPTGMLIEEPSSCGVPDGDDSGGDCFSQPNDGSLPVGEGYLNEGLSMQCALYGDDCPDMGADTVNKADCTQAQACGDDETDPTTFENQDEEAGTNFAGTNDVNTPTCGADCIQQPPPLLPAQFTNCMSQWASDVVGRSIDIGVGQAFIALGFWATSTAVTGGTILVTEALFVGQAVIREAITCATGH
jgi:RHS repeat-associated protein